MSVRSTIQVGHPALKAHNQVVTEFADSKVQQVITDLIDTMRHNELIGMAAPQIAENYHIFVTEPRHTKTRSQDQTDELRVYINPKIIKSSSEQSIIYEGCGSVLNGTLFGPVERPHTITVEAYDQTGNLFHFTADGILGRVIQHEYDHLQGVEFLEKVSDYTKVMTVEHYLEQVRHQPWHRDASEITIKQLESA